MKSAKTHSFDTRRQPTASSEAKRQQCRAEIVILDDDDDDDDESDDLQEIRMLPTPTQTPQKQSKTKAGKTPVKQRPVEDKEADMLTRVGDSSDPLGLTLPQKWRLCAMWKDKNSLKDIAASLRVGESALHGYLYRLLKNDIE